MKINVLITSSGGALSPKVIEFLKNSKKYDIKIIAVDCNKKATSKYFADEFEIVPEGNSHNYFKVIEQTIKKYKVNVIIPFSDEEAVSLSKNRSKLKNLKVRFLLPKPEVLKIITDKTKTYEKFHKLNIKLPKWEKLKNEKKFKEQIKNFLEINKTCVVKPAIGRGGRDIFIINDQKNRIPQRLENREKNLTFEKFMKYEANNIIKKNYFIMEKLFKPAFDVDILCKNGLLLNIIIRKRINPHGIPFQGSEIVWSEKVLKLTKIIIKGFDLSGLLDIDIMTNQNGELIVTEINPRPSGAVSASILAGVPVLDQLIATIMGNNLKKISFMKNKKKIIPFTDLKVVK